MRWIDSHVHLFSDNDENSKIPLLFPINKLNSYDNYSEQLNEQEPEAIVVVDFSKSKDSQHVISSLEELKQAGKKAVGIIKGDIANENTKKWIEREDIKGIRLYAINSVPDLSSPQWQELFTQLKENSKHILVFGSGNNLIGLINQIPNDITILVDHFGLTKIGENDNNFAQLLEIARKRNNIFFKGPGYRTNLDIEKVKPIVKRIKDTVGIDKLILGASDAPFAGPVLDSSPEYEGKNYCEYMNFKNVLDFISELANDSSSNESEIEKTLYYNAKELYGF